MRADNKLKKVVERCYQMTNYQASDTFWKMATVEQLFYRSYTSVLNLCFRGESMANITQATRVYVQCWRKENKGEGTGCDIYVFLVLTASTVKYIGSVYRYLINRTHIIGSLDQPCY
jgi:hypothetical protein